jgi:hypothetical protein
MISQELYTKFFLKEWGKSTDDANLRLYKHTWWYNTRTKNQGGLRLTDKGLEFLITELKLRDYEIPFLDNIELNPQLIIFLDNFLDCPYFLGHQSLTVFSEKKSFELYMFSDDIRRYGLIKALKKQKESKET